MTCVARSVLGVAQEQLHNASIAAVKINVFPTRDVAYETVRAVVPGRSQSLRCTCEIGTRALPVDQPSDQDAK